ncbi:hypothetical protein N7474_004895 [Penicillium riverlandense]|uniref:uncharacterized protein n=1 Tax=Penicillium riverlandense TaxID=1903569 RepID=UPI0025481B66|nr:uncharacterized protein N7474_004895 [Penicillium riverlandense]KAJ5819304.1 hypothetical protein N7474_004895 [Penicillium riverlandense]
MDAQAYLLRHGWSGPGNPLNPNQRPGPHGGLGLTRPILVARKQNNHGVGKKTTKDPTNQWWLRGFEDALKGIGEENADVDRSNNALTSELYRFFVRGTGLAGTITERKEEQQKAEAKVKSKRKREAEDDEDRQAKREKKAARKEEKRKRRELKDGTAETGSAQSSSETSNSEKCKESKEERRLRRKEKKEKKEKERRKLDGDGALDVSKKAKSVELSAIEGDYPTPMSTDTDSDPDRLDYTTTNDDSARRKEKKNSKAKRTSRESKKSKKKESGADVESKVTKKSKKDKKDKKTSKSKDV